MTLIRDGILACRTLDQMPRKTDVPVKTYQHANPACACGKRLSVFNPDDECWQCQFNRDSERTSA